VDRAFRLGWVTVEARIQAERGFFREGQGGELTVIRTDLNGTPRPGKASYRVVALEAPPPSEAAMLETRTKALASASLP